MSYDLSFLHSTNVAYPTASPVSPTPIIVASDFGNLWTFAIALPALLLSLLAGLIGAVGRLRWLIISSSALAFSTGALFFWTLHYLADRDGPETQFCGVGAVCLGLLTLVGLLLPRR